MSAGHTPGPWFVTETDGTWVEDGKTPIAPICNYVGPEQRAANARLIAAAPDLLEAVILAREALHQHYVDWDGEPEDAVPLQHARAECDAAIAKALGHD